MFIGAQMPRKLQDSTESGGILHHGAVGDVFDDVAVARLQSNFQLPVCLRRTPSLRGAVTGFAGGSTAIPSAARRDKAPKLIIFRGW
jgi:hypothetical protein